MDKLSLQNPVFATYVIAATLMILKAVSMSWLTVIRMMQVKGGFRSPEDIKKTPLNRAPNPKQLEPNERVERIRRIQLNDLENLPFFLVAGFLFVLTEPSLVLARWLLYGYVVSRLLHFAAYFTARTHDTRATLWTVGSVILIFMTCRTANVRNWHLCDKPTRPARVRFWVLTGHLFARQPRRSLTLPEVRVDGHPTGAHIQFAALHRLKAAARDGRKTHATSPCRNPGCRCGRLQSHDGSR